ncbi:MAG: AAA family ATPase [Planctomycetes bacterium]|nr:AAA family ATPase [Planctomycetota bacterium]
MRKIYVAATQQHDGKTTISVGLYRAALNRELSASFIKPVGQRYIERDGVAADEDAVLFKQALAADGELQEISPVLIPRGFTRDYIFDRRPEHIRGQITEAFEKVACNKDVAIIEGTGHAGVGSVIDASNAEVAELLGADVLIVSGGGIGSCIDEIALNRALFERQGVNVLGAVINKVYESKYDKVSDAVKQGLKNIGIDCLGVIPYKTELTYPTIVQLRDELNLEVLTGQDHLDSKVEDIIVGAMEPQNMVGYLETGCLVVVPGDRVDNIVTCINAHLMRDKAPSAQVAGLLLTGGLIPHLSIVNLMCQVDVPVLLSEEDTATAAYRARRLVAKITPQDRNKLELAQNLVQKYVTLDKILGVNEAD